MSTVRSNIKEISMNSFRWRSTDQSVRVLVLSKVRTVSLSHLQVLSIIYPYQSNFGGSLSWWSIEVLIHLNICKIRALITKMAVHQKLVPIDVYNHSGYRHVHNCSKRHTNFSICQFKNPCQSYQSPCLSRVHVWLFYWCTDLPYYFSFLSYGLTISHHNANNTALISRWLD